MKPYKDAFVATFAVRIACATRDAVRLVAQVALPLLAALSALLLVPAPGIASVSGPVDLGTVDGYPKSTAVAVSTSGQVVGYSVTQADVYSRAMSWTSTGGLVDVGSLGGSDSHPVAVNASGRIAGSSNTSSGPMHAFSWTATRGMVDLGTLGGLYSQATGMNAAGQVVGASNTTGEGPHNHAFSWTAADGMVDLGTLGGSQSFATAINALGQVVGFSQTPGDVSFHAFSWTASGGMMDLGTLGGSQSFGVAVNDSGQVAGSSNTTGDASNHAFLWTAAAGMADLGTVGGPFSSPTSLSASGQVVGVSLAAGSNQQVAFSWTQTGGMVNLGTLGGSFSAARSVSAAGAVVGSSAIPGDDATHAFLWTSSGGMVDLGTLNGGSSNAVAVSGSLIVGDSVTPGNNNYHAVIWRFADTPQDTTPPTITVPSNPLIAEATGPSGATVTYTATATDPTDGVVTPTCSPASGTLFGLDRPTTVTCTAADKSNNIATATFVVEVVDTTPPVLSVSADVTVDATSPAGGSASFSSTATDLVDGPVTPVCSLSGMRVVSGGTFPIGTSAITCVASDVRQNVSAPQSFRITVLGASQQAVSLRTSVDGIGPGRSFASQVDAVVSSLASADYAGARTELRAFENHVRAASGKQISPATAQTLLAAADRILAVIG